jgi:maltose-binding protein MalE
MRRSAVSLPVVMAAVVLMLASCGTGSASTPSPSSTATTTAKSVACSGLATVGQVLASLSDTKVTATVGDVQSAQQKVTDALNKIESKIPAASGQMLDQIRSANDQLTAKLQGYPPETPIGQTSVTVQEIKSSVASAQAKTTVLATALKCPA